jgi:hypothetical protein
MAEETNKVDLVNKGKLVDPKGGNEDNNTTDNVDTQYTVLVNGERIILYTDKWGASLQDKLEGHGIHIQKNGDVAILTGKGGKGNACGGRLLVNTAKGQLVKSGPIVTEVVASKVDPGEGGGSSDNGKSAEAISVVAYGDSTEEIVGAEKTIKAEHITLDADTITFRAGTKVFVDAPEWVEVIGMKKSVVDSSDEVVSQKVTEVKEETTLSFDPRASKNIVSRGHLNHRILGDYALKVDGYMDLQVMGGVPVGEPLIKNRSAALTIGVNGEKNGGKFFVFTKGTFDLASGLGAGGGDLTFSTLGKFETSSTKETKIEATTDVKLDATKEVEIKATTDVKLDATTKVEIKGKTGVDIEATTNNVTVKAPAGNFDVDALKIYLN